MSVRMGQVPIVEIFVFHNFYVCCYTLRQEKIQNVKGLKINKINKNQ